MGHLVVENHHVGARTSLDAVRPLLRRTGRSSSLISSLKNRSKTPQSWHNNTMKKITKKSPRGRHNLQESHSADDPQVRGSNRLWGTPNQAENAHQHITMVKKITKDSSRKPP